MRGSPDGKSATPHRMVKWSPGNLQYIPWLAGMTRAKYYTFTCEPMSGLEAFQAQWASESVPGERLEERTEELARQIALTPTAGRGPCSGLP